jgi:ABC-type sugar transport system ATPase subunit
MAQVTFDKIRKEYQDGTVAVPSLDLEIADGEFMVLVGPSGCGKSTALRMIAGLEEITDGTLNIGERTVNDLPPGERDVAMVFQNYALYPHMTVRGNMGFALEMAKVPKDQIAERVDKAAAILGLTAYLDRTPKALSGGQRQRVAMGRAIVREPSVFLMDEPLSNLDAKLRVQMRGEIIRLQRELATTMVYVTHDQVEAMTMGDRVAVMRKGILQQVAPPQDLYERPNNLFVAGFIGSPAMNFLTASPKGKTASTPPISVISPWRSTHAWPNGIRVSTKASGRTSSSAYGPNTLRTRREAPFPPISTCRSPAIWLSQWAPRPRSTSACPCHRPNSRALPSRPMTRRFPVVPTTRRPSLPASKASCGSTRVIAWPPPFEPTRLISSTPKPGYPSARTSMVCQAPQFHLDKHTDSVWTNVCF